jgi:hypothetical protein
MLRRWWLTMSADQMSFDLFDGQGFHDLAPCVKCGLAGGRGLACWHCLTNLGLGWQVAGLGSR